jgi:hypothetical protein
MFAPFRRGPIPATEEQQGRPVVDGIVALALT